MISAVNVYKMLTYSFGILDSDTNISSCLDGMDNNLEVLARILIRGIAYQRARGLDHAYERKTELLSSVRGSINVADTIRGDYLSQMKVVCDFDEFTENSRLNQILKFTARRALSAQGLTGDTQHGLSNSLLMLNAVGDIQYSDIHWARLSYSRNNENYRMLMNICYLMIEGMYTNNLEMNSFLDNEYSARLFMRFLPRFFERHYDVELTACDASKDAKVRNVGIFEYAKRETETYAIRHTDGQALLRFMYYDDDYVKTTGLKSEDMAKKEVATFKTYIETLNVSGKPKYKRAAILFGGIPDDKLTGLNGWVSGTNVFVYGVQINGSWYRLTHNLRDIMYSLIRSHPQHAE